jgi:hypothetical protein
LNETEQRREQNGRKRGGSGEKNKKKTVGLVERSGKKSGDGGKKQKIEFVSEN